ncbi:hypothetical protein D3C80_1415280 [compost metagenome]
MVQGDGQIVVVQPPQFLKGELGLPAGVDEDQGGARRLDGLIDLGHGVLSGVTGPRDAVLGQQNLQLRRGAGLAHDQIVAAIRQPAPHARRVIHRGRQADTAQVGRKISQPRQSERQQVAPL